MGTSDQSKLTCWNCEEELPRDANYCSQCTIRVSPFPVTEGTGFLEQESKKYLSGVVKGELSYPKDTNLDDEFEQDLQAQVRQDTRKAIEELAFVCNADEDLLTDSIDTSAVEAKLAGEEVDTEDYSPSVMGLISIVDVLANKFENEIFDAFRNIDDRNP